MAGCLHCHISGILIPTAHQLSHRHNATHPGPSFAAVVFDLEVTGTSVRL